MSKSEQFMLLRQLRIKSGVAKAVLRCVHDHAGKSGVCWASLSTLANESCFSRRTVIRAIADLEAEKLLIAGRHEGKTTTYKIDWQVVADQCHSVTSDSPSLVTLCHQTSDSLSKTSDSLSPKTVETKRNSKRARTQFVPPSLEAVRAYCDSRSSSVDPQKFWDYFTAGDWKDSNGKAVANWKQKLLTWENHTPAAASATSTESSLPYFE